MKKVVEYKLITSTAPSCVEMDVNNALKKGYELYQPLEVVKGPSSTVYAQLMVKYEENN